MAGVRFRGSSRGSALELLPDGGHVGVSGFVECFGGGRAPGFGADWPRWEYGWSGSLLGGGSGGGVGWSSNRRDGQGGVRLLFLARLPRPSSSKSLCTHRLRPTQVWSMVSRSMTTSVTSAGSKLLLQMRAAKKLARSQAVISSRLPSGSAVTAS